jgi:hypothetical protein
MTRKAMTMHRRRVLQVGAALATLPLASCGPSTPDPKLASTATKDATASDKAVHDKAAAGNPDAAATAGNAPVAPPDDKVAGKDPAPDPVKDEAAKSPYSRVIGKVGKNHGHVLTVSFEDVKAGAEKTYDLAGTSGHPHTVTLSPDDMKNLLAGQIFRTKSSRDRQHAHRVLVRCAPPVDPPEWVTVCEATFTGQDEHELVVPAADMAAKADQTYDVQGVAGHAHEVKLTAAHFQSLVKGEAVSLNSTRDPADAHLHVVFIRYRAPKT